MDAQIFWNIIGRYNEDTFVIQSVLLVFLILSILLSYTGKVKWLAKLALGLANFYIGIVFFGKYGTEPIQKFFAFPLFLLSGSLFLYESVHNRDDSLPHPGPWQGLLIFLYLLYPVTSILLGNRFPQMVTYIMPCPVVSLSLAVYSGYRRKNRLLLVLLTVWGLTGIKSVVFRAYEDIILLICGVYGIFLIAEECKIRLKKA